MLVGYDVRETLQAHMESRHPLRPKRWTSSRPLQLSSAITVCLALLRWSFADTLHFNVIPQDVVESRLRQYKGDDK